MRHSTPERAASTTLTKSNWFDLSDTKYKEKGIMMSEQCNPSVGQSNQNDALQRKRVRAGSISGRLRFVHFNLSLLLDFLTIIVSQNGL